MKLGYGIFNIYKPAGPTSHDIINQVRKMSGEKRVGHAGTLDPFAEGVLIVAVGREYTKKLGQFLKQDKTYRATVRLGAESDTFDLTGKVSRVSLTTSCLPKLQTRGYPNLGSLITKKNVTSVLNKFIGEIEQIPPSFSAIKIKGKKAYELARKGIVPNLKPRKVKIYSIKILKYKWPYLEIETKVSSGTYIRSLAHDLGQTLKIGGYLEKLVRIKTGSFNLQKSLRLYKVK